MFHDEDEDFEDVEFHSGRGRLEISIILKPIKPYQTSNSSPVKASILFWQFLQQLKPVKV